jgi:hypothetical protein
MWTNWRKVLTTAGLELRLLGSQARSQSLYRLNYIGSQLYLVRNANYEALIQFELSAHGPKCTPLLPVLEHPQCMLSYCDTQSVTELLLS